MESRSSNQSDTSDEDRTIEYSYEVPPRRGRRVQRGRGVANRRPRGRVQRQQRQAAEIAAALLRKKERLRELIAELQEQELRTILVASIEKSPDLLWDLLDCGHYDGQPPSPSPPSQSPPSPSSTSGPSWCVCSHCRDMPTVEERLCCGKLPQYCLSTLPHFQLVALDENVLQIANIYRQDIFAYPQDADQNRGYRHAGYRQYIMWQHGRLGAGVRRVIPSCCVWAIRDTYPDLYGQYVGFVPGRLG